MTYTQVIAYIQQWITDNNNKEITASVMRDVLDKILLYVRDSIGDVDDLQQGADIVDAINILFGEITNLNIDFPIQVHEGASDPNITPPTGFNAPDFYIRNGVQTYIYTGISWVLIQDNAVFTPSLELVAQEGNTTSRKLVGTDYFENKDDNDFAQIKDLEGVQVAGLELRFFDGNIEWRIGDDSQWRNLFNIDEITPEFRVSGSVFEYRQTPTSPWVEITDFSDFYPTIGNNGNWWIDGQDTGVSATAMPTTVYDDDIAGIRDGQNTEFFAPDAYISGTLAIYLDGQRLSRGNNKDYIEISEGAKINRVITPKNLLIFEYIKAQ